jgi:hypothetical protein
LKQSIGEGVLLSSFSSFDQAISNKGTTDENKSCVHKTIEIHDKLEKFNGVFPHQNQLSHFIIFQLLSTSIFGQHKDESA